MLSNTDTQHGVHQPAGIKNNTRATTGTTRMGGDKQHKCSQVHTQKTTLSHLRVLKIIPVVHFR